MPEQTTEQNLTSNIKITDLFISSLEFSVKYWPLIIVELAAKVFSFLFSIIPVLMLAGITFGFYFYYETQFTNITTYIYSFIGILITSIIAGALVTAFSNAGVFGVYKNRLIQHPDDNVDSFINIGSEYFIVFFLTGFIWTVYSIIIWIFEAVILLISVLLWTAYSENGSSFNIFIPTFIMSLGITIHILSYIALTGLLRIIVTCAVLSRGGFYDSLVEVYNFIEDNITVLIRYLFLQTGLFLLLVISAGFIGISIDNYLSVNNSSLLTQSAAHFLRILLVAIAMIFSGALSVGLITLYKILGYPAIRNKPENDSKAEFSQKFIETPDLPVDA